MKIIGSTDSTYLRETDGGDAAVFYQLNLDPEVIQYTGDKAFSSVEEPKDFYIQYNHFEKYNRGRWAVVSKQNNEILGGCGLKYHKSNKASLRVIEKLGMVYEKDFEEHGDVGEQFNISKYDYMIQSPDIQINIMYQINL